jgi:phosphopantothenoylcysteine synthetase/decarboxylase
MKATARAAFFVFLRVLRGWSRMNLLVTAGNTQTPIDRVRAITNIFTGRTGAGIALHALERDHTVTLLTSHPEVVAEMAAGARLATDRWTVVSYRTFDDLQQCLEGRLRRGGFDAVIHSAAVSDYRPVGVYAPAAGTCFRADERRWESAGTTAPTLVDMAAGKVKSDAPELWLRLERTPKLIDRIRTDWGFTGVLVKFKLEVGISEDRLLEIAERSRRQSDADLMVANTLEGASTWAYLGPFDGRYQRVSRRELATRLLTAVEQKQKERSHG